MTSADPIADLLLPEQIHLILQKDDAALASGTWAAARKAFASGLVWELQRTGAIAVHDNTVRPLSRTTDLGAEYQSALDLLEQPGRFATAPSVQTFIKNVEESTGAHDATNRDRLVGRGLVEPTQSSILLVIPTTQFKRTSAGEIAQVALRTQTRRALDLLRAEPDRQAFAGVAPRIAMLALLLDSFKLLKAAFPDENRDGLSVRAATVAALAGLGAMFAAGAVAHAQTPPPGQPRRAQPTEGEGIGLEDVAEGGIEVAAESVEVGNVLMFVPDLLRGIAGVAGNVGEMVGGAIGSAAEAAVGAAQATAGNVDVAGAAGEAAGGLVEGIFGILGGIFDN